MMLQVLREHQLYAKLSKCSFCQRKIHYLGYIISKEGIVVDPTKIKYNEECPTLRNITKVRSFMGLAGYYKIFIEGFSQIAHPITSLQKKGVLFEQNLDCARSFQHLKSLLTSVSILEVVDPNVEFVVCMDKCKEGLSGLLSQNGHVVCYK